jgi:prevent-host-death family protein
VSRTLTVPAAEANRRFSKLLRAVKEGARVIITSHGQAVAELGPLSDRSPDAEQRRLEAAQRRLEARWASADNRVIGPWTREQLYGERDI